MSTPTPTGPLAIAQTLQQTLAAETDALQMLHDVLVRHLDAVRTRQTAQMEEASDATHEAMASLQGARLARERQMRLLARVLALDEDAPLPALAEALQAQPEGAATARTLLDCRTCLRALADATRQRSDELEFTLDYALRLSREMLLAAQGLQAPPPAGMYDATGHSMSSAAASMLNKLG